MKAILVRIGVDQQYGRWNAPVDKNGIFVYVPIPEKIGTLFHSGLERRYGEVLPSLHRFCAQRNVDLCHDLHFPQALLEHAMHLDPDFECLTYGNRGNNKGSGFERLVEGDILVFYGGFRPIHDCADRLVYALVGMYLVREVVHAACVSSDRRYENAHVRKAVLGAGDVVVRANPCGSGRFDRCIPIGEWRDRAYRVRPDVLDFWGGLSVKDGFIQRSAVPPEFNDPERFLGWLNGQNVQLIQRNN